VSKTTVSRVLNDKPDVDKETRRRILEIIKELNYVPSATAKSLATGRRNLIGLLAPSLSRPWSLEVIRGVAEGLEDTEYELVLYTTSLAGKNQELFAKALNNDLTDGLLVMLPRDGKGYLSTLLQDKLPLVLIDHRELLSGFPSVTASNKEGAYEATRHLLDLGHCRIGFICGLMDFGCSRERLEGYKLALAEAGLPFSPELVKEGDFSEASGFARTEEWLNSPDPPSAIFASNDEMALGVLEAVRVKGMTVPDDIAVVGFDDIPAASYTVPPLTTVKQPLRAMGRKAVEMLLQQIMGRGLESLEVELETELIIRESCGYRCDSIS